MTRAIWNGKVVAESQETVVVEGNHYFPPGSVDPTAISDSDHTSRCPWKGIAHYKDVVVGDEVNADAAWYYPEPSRAAREIAGYYAFWRGVEVQA